MVRDGRVLLCRKRRDTALLILPGGKREAAESALQCLAREIAEELGGAQMTDVAYVGTYSDRAAVEGKTVEIELYRGDIEGEARPSGEIAELVWFGAADDPAQLAPSLRNTIFPALKSKGLLPW